MYLAVLAAQMAVSAGDPPGHGDSLLLEQPRPRPRNHYPWDAFVGPIPGDAVRHEPRMQPGVPPDWRWPQDFIHDLVRWARALAGAPGPAQVSSAELALDYAAFVGRALPASPDHRLWGTRLLLGERAQVLRKAVGLAERHLAAGALLGGAPLGRCRSLLPLGGRVCAGLSARPYFAARHEVMLQLMRLAAHCRDSWGRRLQAPARMRPQHSDRFLMDYFPRPLEGGPPLLPYARRPPGAPSRSVPLAAPQRSRPPSAGSGTQGALCSEHGAPSCARCRSLGWGISCCCRAGHEAHAGTSGGLGCPVAPPRIAPGRQVLVPEARRAGAAALSSWLGRARPASQALADSGPREARRCAAPPRVLGTRPSPALGPDASRPAKRQAPNRANRGVPGGVSHRAAGGGATDPLSPQPAGGGGQQPETGPPCSLRPRGGHGGAAGWGGGRARLVPAGRGGCRIGAGPPLTLRRSGGLKGAHDAALPPPAAPPSRATPAVAPRSLQPHLSGPEQPRTAAAAVPSAGAAMAPTQGHQDVGGHAARAPAFPTSLGRRGRRGLPLL